MSDEKEIEELGGGDMLESTGEKKGVFFTFGRFQPPTKGHLVLFDKLVELAGDDADAYVFVSSTEGKDNPLTVYEKVYFLRKMYPNTSLKFINTTTCDCRQLPVIVGRLKELYSDLTMVLGSDRAEGSLGRGAKFLEGVRIETAGTKRNLAGNSENENSTENNLGDENLENLDAGKNESSVNLATISGSKMRKAATRKSKFKNFVAGTKMGTMTDEDVKELYRRVRQGLYRNRTEKRRRRK